MTKLPVLKTETGSVFGVISILRYFARLSPEMKLYGSNFEETT